MLAAPYLVCNPLLCTFELWEDLPKRSKYIPGRSAVRGFPKGFGTSSPELP
jgi:hypothetical protein